MKLSCCYLVGLLSILFCTTVSFANEIGEAQRLVDKALQDINNNIHLSEDKINKLTQEVAALHQNQTSLNKALTQSSEKMQQLKNNLVLDEQKLKNYMFLQQESQRALNKVSKNFGIVISALTTIGLDPPPALIVQPADMQNMVRGADLLSFMLPKLQNQAVEVQQELHKLTNNIKAVAEQKKNFVRDLEEQAATQKKMQLLIAEKARSENEAKTELAQNLQNKIELAQKAHNLQDFLANIQATRIEQSQTSQLHLAEEKLRKSIAFEKLKGKLELPIKGEMEPEIRGLGQHIKVKLGGVVVTPADAVTLYAGSFRSYGNMVILDVGDNYYLIISGLKEIYVKAGMFINKKSTLGRMDTNGELRIEFRRGKQVINSAEWWAR